MIRGCITTDPVVNDLPTDVASYPGSYEATPAPANVDSDNVYMLTQNWERLILSWSHTYQQ